MLPNGTTGSDDSGSIRLGNLPGSLNVSLGVNNIAVSRLNDEMHDIEYIAEGSFGVVKRGVHDLDERCYAIKQTKDPISGEGDLQQRLQEVYALSACQHRNIVRYYDGWVDDDVAHIRTEWLPESVSKLSRPLPESTLAAVTHQIASALHHLHSRNIIHRDVKPENILSRQLHDGSFTYKLCDFGLSRPAFRDIATTGEHFRGINDDDGDRNYLSPEAYECCDLPQGSFGVDIYALGCTCVDLMGGDPSQIRNGVYTCDFSLYSSEIEELVREMTGTDPGKRPTAFEIAARTIPERAITPDVIALQQELACLKQRVQDIQQSS